MRSHSPEATERRPAAAATVAVAVGFASGELPPLLPLLPLVLPAAVVLLVALLVPLAPAAAGPRSWNRRNFKLELPALSTSSLLRAAMLILRWYDRFGRRQFGSKTKRWLVAAAAAPLSHRPACGGGASQKLPRTLCCLVESSV